jgi:hypothetical protein
MSGRPIQCCITVRGRVARHWSRWLGELALCYRATGEEEEVTDLIGTLPDQSALQGVLNRVWNLNLTVLSVSTSPGEAGGDEAHNGPRASESAPRGETA